MNIPLLRTGYRVLRTTPWALLAGCAVAAVCALSGCHRDRPSAATPAIVVAGPVRALSGSGTGESLRYPVEAAARDSTALSFRVAGKLLERKVRLGDAVHRGQVVARLDPADAKKQASSAQAVFDAAEHRLIFAKQQLDRDQAQAAQNLIAANQLEQTQDAYAAASAGQAQSAAQLVMARNSLQYHTLLAEHDGVITSENADTGQVVSAGQSVYGLAWTGDTDVVLDTAAGDLDRIAVGQSASVTFPALPGRRFEARVREVAPAADQQSRTFRVKLTLEPGTPVRLGMTGEATLLPRGDAGGENAGGAPAGAPVFKIPATAIFHSGKDPAVWVIRAKDSTLELRPVTVQAYGERSATVTAGLRAGESILLAGVHTVFADEHVKPIAPLFAGDSDNEGASSAVAP